MKKIYFLPLNQGFLKTLFDLTSIRNSRGGIGDLVSWLIRVVIYDICVTTIAEVLGVSRLVALFIFLGILALVSFGAYVLKQKTSSKVDD